MIKRETSVVCVFPAGVLFGYTPHKTGVVDYMPLDDKEQRILAEIERQFYEEDPELARAVERIERPSRIGVKLSVLGVLAGLVLVIVYLSVTWVAVAGFALVVLSATSLVNGLRLRGWSDEGSEPEDAHPE